MASKPIRKCRRCGWTHADDYDGCLKPKPARRRSTDTERLDALLRWIDQSGHPEWIKFKKDWVYITTRRDIDKLLREEARDAKS